MIRNTAASQLGDVQKQHPDELFNLLARVVPFLRSRGWDTRTAAAKAVGAIAENAPIYNPNPLTHIKDHTDRGLLPDSNGAQLSSSGASLRLENLDIGLILRFGKKLLGSDENGTDHALGSLDPVERLEFLKRTLPGRLGLQGEYVEAKVEDVFPEKAVKVLPSKLDTSMSGLLGTETVQSPSPYAASPRGSFSNTTSEEVGLSKRQLNQLKRKNKIHAKQGSSNVRAGDLAVRRQSSDIAVGSRESDRKHGKSEVKSENGENGLEGILSLKREDVDEDAKIISDFKGSIVEEKSAIQTEAEEAGLEWPYERLCDFLKVDLFDPSWEIRHGAAMGLREIIRVHGAGAGRLHDKDQGTNDQLNSQWLDDLACRLCCVLMLDRYGDYANENVVAIIRETVGQTLGTLLVHLQQSKVMDIYQVLYNMVMQRNLGLDMQIWQVCQGGMIGLRYLVAVRSDLLKSHENLLDGVVDAVMTGLAHGDDDVRAVSAATLTPIAKDFVSIRPASLGDIMGIVWNCLADLSDDLSASTGNVMDLLAKLCSFPEALGAMQQNALKDPGQSFDMLVPRLYPFLRHTITGVRSAVLRALQTFLKIEDASAREWIKGRTLRLLFQNLLVERNEKTLQESLTVWNSILQILSSFDPGALMTELLPNMHDLLLLTLQPIGSSRNPIPIDISLMMRPNGQMYAPPANPSERMPENQPPTKRRKRSEKKEEPPQFAHNVDGHMIQGDIDLVGLDTLIRSRITAAKAYGKALSVAASQTTPDVIMDMLLKGTTSLHSSTQLTACVILEEYASETGSANLARIAEVLRTVVEGDRPESYADIVPYLRIARAQCHSLINCFRDQGQVASSKLPNLAVIVQGEPTAGPNAFSIANAETIVGSDFERLRKALPPAQRLTLGTALKDDRAQAMTAIDDAKNAKSERDIRIKAAAACALVAVQDIPKKPSALIKAIMDSVKLDENSELQRRSAHGISSLIHHYANSDRRGPADKIIGNLIKFYCMDTAETPEFYPNATIKDSVLSLKKDEDLRDSADMVKYQLEAKGARITRRGAKEALDRLSYTFAGHIFTTLPSLKQKIESPLRQLLEQGSDIGKLESEVNEELGQEIVDGLSVLRALSPNLHPDLYPFLSDMTLIISEALQAPLAVFRYTAAKCLATVANTLQVKGMTMLIEQVLPLSGSMDLHTRQGVIELIYHLIQVMGDNILPYTIFLIVHVLGRMSDSDSDIRLLATTTFATLVKLVPLEAGIPDPPGFPQSLLEGRDRERQFIAQMLDPKKVEPFQLPVAIKAELRSYQQEGVNWLAFLNRHHLHGILCDDMGLGKTLQTLCIVASDHHMRAETFDKTQSPDSRRMPSLIVCPPTLSGHWQQEIRTFAPFLSCLAYVGPPSDRAALRSRLGKTDIVITSYDVCRNDQEILAPINWNYCVLDEGHLIKNPRAKTSIAVKRLASNHRLILSGTPIQNNVVELWSLFDFLMPGFLGTEKIFQDRFAKPIAASRFSKSSSKEQEAGALAIEALHKQVLPFLLRRLKEQVLDDLPPKILQNYYCDLSDLQRKLFEDFVRKERKDISDKAGSEDKAAKQHIFQALQYMRKLCNSPSLVVREGHKQYPAIQSLLAKQGSSLRDIAHAPKLTALRDLLLDCGIGDTSSASYSGGGDLPSAADTPYVSPHRALIFCQMKEMLDIVQNDVIRKLLPSVQYLRLDGSVEASKRQDIVNRFNTDPSYDVLLLTTQVGGLGLNLTGADTVIFVEHSWNPQQDIQAMDRAHRIGQKKVVNVYRLVTRGTLEEKILKYVCLLFSPISPFIIAFPLPSFPQSLTNLPAPLSQPPTLQNRHRLHGRQPTKLRARYNGNRPNPRSLQPFLRIHRPKRRSRYHHDV